MSDRGYGGGDQPRPGADGGVGAACDGGVPAGSAGTAGAATNAAGEPLVLVDDPAEGVRRLTLNRPEKRNALNNPLRGALLAALRAADGDDAVRVTIVRGAGTCFSAGYDLGDGNEGHDHPHFTAPGEGHWPRHVTETWMGIWDLATPVIAQVHGW